MKNRRRFAATVFLLFSLVLCQCVIAAGSKNLIPRMPEIVIERGYSDSFQVVDCVCSSSIYDETAESSIRVVLKNVTDKTIETSVKVRILYLASEHGAQVLVDGKARPFSRKSPRIPFTLGPGQSVDLQVKAKHNIQFSLDALKKEQSEAGGFSNGATDEKKKFSLNELVKLFDRESFGRRFLIGPLVSKWGIFPVDFKRVRIDITVPRDFVGLFPKESIWQKTERNNGILYSFEGSEGYIGSIFLPKADIKNEGGQQPHGVTASSEHLNLK